MMGTHRELRGKVILITGGSSGIGAATALACARAGMDVTLAARRGDKLRDIAERIEALGRRALTVPCDVRRDDDVNDLFAAHWQAFGRLDACYANAGYGLLRSLEDTTAQQHRDIFETNYWGTIRTIHAALPSLRNTPDGLKHLLICSSAASEIGLPMFGPYCATKAAQDSIAGALRCEVRHEGIHVTSVHPVGTKTEFFTTAQRVSGDAEPGIHTPRSLSQTAEHVADRTLAVLRRPRAELWPSPLARLGLAGATALPGLTFRLITRKFEQLKREAADGRAG